jgi:hypothetical protein
MFIGATAMLFSLVAAADTTSFSYNDTPTVHAGTAMGSYTSTPEPGWTWSAGWGVINPYTPGAQMDGVPDPSSVSNGNANAFNWAGANPLTINFSTPQMAVSIDVADLNYTSSAASVELIAYNSNGVAIDSNTLALDLVNGSFLSLGVTEGTADISKVAFIGLDGYGQPSGSDDLNEYAIADVTATTPEPGTISLLGSGLLGLAGMLKLRRRSA